MFQSLLFALNIPPFWTRDFVLDFKDQLQLFSVVFVITLCVWKAVNNEK